MALRRTLRDTLIETLTQRWGIKTGENRHDSYKKKRWNVPLGSERQGLVKKEGKNRQESYKKSRWKGKGGNKTIKRWCGVCFK
ncbi:hypothetical protein TNCV_2286021 [Trichonephila clavipes]|nr:hypothetical protein TNCV_2286021 [Trichonephila clavipes]